MITIKTRNVDKVSQMITELPRKVRGIATVEASKYIIGNERRGLQYYPPRPSSTYRRTYALRFGWQVSSWDDGAKTKIQNAVPYAPYVQGDNDQAWMHKGIWRKVSDVIADNIKGAMVAVDQAVQRWIKQHEVK